MAFTAPLGAVRIFGAQRRKFWVGAAPDSSPLNAGAKNFFHHRVRGRWPGEAQGAETGRRGEGYGVDVDHNFTFKALAMVKMSLSPRPHIFIRMI
jgi:hypothetical protein